MSELWCTIYDEEQQYESSTDQLQYVMWAPKDHFPPDDY